MDQECEGDGTDRELDRAIEAALATGCEEMARLDEMAESAIGCYSVSPEAAALLGQVSGADRVGPTTFTTKLRSHLSEQRDVLSTFNVAFFGRTGAGKSTLLSAFGQLDGSDVSPGDSDWTTEVHSVSWRGCRLYDTPGINGWGGRRSRAELEATARRAVEIADVVLLCFDSQSQQASEFAKVADWVRHYGKPTIAVLNIRNLRWRHPAKMPSQSARRNVSEPVRQHSDNIRTELASIGLDNTPVVAIHSRRALFARASTPFRGPAERDFLCEREQFGTEYLAEWSNFRVLESLLTAGITAGGAQLRLTSLREGMRAILHDEARALRALDTRLKEQFDEIDRAVVRHLDVLGYLETDERAALLHDDEWSGDLLSIAETARGAPYLAPSDGSYSRYLRSLLKPHLAAPRSEALKRFKQLERDAFESRKDVDEDTFVKSVFDEGEIAASLELVWTESARFLERELSIATAELRHHAVFEERGSSDLRGSAGAGSRNIETALRASGILSGVTAAIGVVALANAWNPIGWAGGVVVAGVSIASSALSFFGGRQGDSAERQRAEARARAAYAGRTAIRTTFDDIEKNFANDARSVVWSELAAGVRPLLRELSILARLRNELKSVAEQLSVIATEIVEPTSVAIFNDAQKKSAGGLGDRRAIERVLLGENWFEVDTATDEAAMTNDKAFLASCRARRIGDTQRLETALRNALARPDTTRVADWTQLLASAARRDVAFRAALVASTPPRGERPAIVIAGDYSAGKSSFIKRLLVEMGWDVPESLHIRADATTDQVSVYQAGVVDVIDTPGFQSGRAGHDDQAESATTNASLVIVLLHVNLLIGDTARLEVVVNGSDAAPGKWPRMLFLINRSDELGVDPLHAIDEYHNRRDRKAAELQAALASRGIDVALQNIHAIAADPFAAVGRQLPVSRSAYDANREWDGVDAFLDALRSLSPADIAQANTLAALDNALAELLNLRADTQAESTAHGGEADKHDSLIRALNECLEDARLLSNNLEIELGEMVSRHTTEAIRKVRAASRGDEEKLAEAMASWNNSELEAEVDGFKASAETEIAEWIATHWSAIRREMAAMRFDKKLGTPVSDDPGSPDSVDDAISFGGFVAEAAQKLAAGAGTRDFAYKVGKAFGHKFKPWGAVKAGQTVARAGVVLQLAAVALDAISWVRTEGKRASWDETVTAAVETIESDSAAQVSDFLRGDNAPVAYLEARCAEIEVLRDDHQSQMQLSRYEQARADKRLAEIGALFDAYRELGKESHESH